MINFKYKENLKAFLFRVVSQSAYYRRREKINTSLSVARASGRKVVYHLVKPPIISNTYSQTGEDVIVAYLLSSLGIKKPTYLDLGTCHPIAANNTYLFYTQGSRGVCVEANPALLEEIKKVRAGDECLNLGLSTSEAAKLDFYVFSSPWVSTFSQEEAEKRKLHYRLESVVSVPQITINALIQRYFDKPPNFVSLDVEGLDLAILQSLDFAKYRPEVFCIETIKFSESRVKEKETDIINFMVEQGYLLYADTYLNSIFVERNRFMSPA